MKAIVWTDNLIDIRPRVNIRNAVQCTADRYGLPARQTRECTHYAISLWRNGKSTAWAITRGQDYVRVLAGVRRWHRPTTGGDAA